MMAVYGSPAQLDLPGVLTRGVRSWFGSLSSPESGSLCLSAGPAGHHPKQCPSPWWCHPALITTEHLLIWWHLLNAFHGMWKQLSVNTWDEASPAILDQLWCSLCVLMAGTAWVGMALCSHLSQLGVTLGLHKGQGSPPTPPGSRITNMKWFQLVFFSWRRERRELSTDLLCQHVMTAVSVQGRAPQVTNSFPAKHQLGISSTTLV